MKTAATELLGIEAPIFAFSHCRDVVVEVSKAGGLGVLGMARMSPERVREELRWIDEHIEGRPYGIDVLMPTTYTDAGSLKYDPERLFPKEQLQFLRDMLDEAGVPPLPAADAQAIEQELVSQFNFTPEESLRMLDIAMEHPDVLLFRGRVAGDGSSRVYLAFSPFGTNGYVQTAQSRVMVATDPAKASDTVIYDPALLPAGTFNAVPFQCGSDQLPNRGWAGPIPIPTANDTPASRDVGCRIAYVAMETGTYYIEAGAFGDNLTGTFELAIGSLAVGADDFADNLRLRHC